MNFVGKVAYLSETACKNFGYNDVIPGYYVVVEDCGVNFKLDRTPWKRSNPKAVYICKEYADKNNHGRFIYIL